MFRIFNYFNKKSRQKRVNASREISASKKIWLGLEPLSIFERKYDHVITARLIGKPVEYVGKVIPFKDKQWVVESVEWGENNNFFVALHVNLLEKILIRKNINELYVPRKYSNRI